MWGRMVSADMLSRPAGLLTACGGAVSYRRVVGTDARFRTICRMFMNQASLFFKEFPEIPTDESSLASLITRSWNPLMEWLKRVETLRDCIEAGGEHRAAVPYRKYGKARTHRPRARPAAGARS